MTARRSLLLGTGATMLARGALAQGAWPDRPVRIIVPFAPAGATDLMGRLLADRYGALTGQSFVVENRAGAAGLIGIEAAMRSPADGYTLLIGTISTHAMNVPLYRNRLPYDPLRDFIPVSRLSSGVSAILVHPSLAVTDVKGLIEYAKARPGELNYGSGGNGTTTHLGAEMFKHMAGVDIVHVPFRAPTQATVALAGNQVQMMVDTLVATRPLVREGRLRMLAVTSPQRLPEFPDLPTVAETLPGFELNGWTGLFLPAGTPAPVLDRLGPLTRDILAEPAIIERMAAAGAVSAPLSPDDFTAFIRAEIARWTRVVQAANIVLD
ncbi:tripartite tricarboxylate transporter substrate binding protein [Roseomonas terrae]|uniref:Tripartite tricarboxylate transporter substrate binding protein n=1 Tax=Neoroseomonas terrae TaxID=424799 RepID=A0ABS5EFC8_9PROT|nr:tripartite tricarboxylate transporter substrate binding protein [Neoroseomonas terrae]MBR0649377.1 tripartite tricarboxylate transporter substrate binding protein [Neoroseomonas terrae]